MGPFCCFVSAEGCKRGASIKMSADLCWAIVRNNHSFLLKKRNVKKPFSTEANNLKNVNSPRYNGFCPNKVVGIAPATGDKGIVLTYKPAKCIVKTTIKAGPRRALNSVSRFVRFNKYRKDLKMMALRRASAILRSQKAVPFKKIHRNRRVSKKAE